LSKQILKVGIILDQMVKLIIKERLG